MKYIICNGSKTLKYYTTFDSIEEVCTFLSKETQCASLHCSKVDSNNVKNCFMITLHKEKDVRGLDFLIYGCEKYAKEEI